MIELPDGDAYLSLAETAELLGLATSTVASKRSRGNFELEPHGDLGKQSPAFLRSEVEALAKARESSSSSKSARSAIKAREVPTATPKPVTAPQPGGTTGRPFTGEPSELIKTGLAELDSVRSILVGAPRRQVIPLLRAEPSGVLLRDVESAARACVSSLPVAKRSGLESWLASLGAQG